MTSQKLYYDEIISYVKFYGDVVLALNLFHEIIKQECNRKMKLRRTLLFQA